MPRPQPLIAAVLCWAALSTGVRRVGDYVRARSEVVHAFYGSNVGVYLTNKQTLAFCRSLATLPTARNAWFIERDGVRLLSSKLKACPR